MAAFAVAASFCFALAQAPAPPGLAVEARGPFSWYLVPSDEVGFKDAPQAFQLTYDGALNSGFGELELAAGNVMQPVNQRIKTLFRGSLPIFEYGFERDSIRYSVETFAAPPGLNPREDLLGFIRIKLVNGGKKPAHAALAARWAPPGKFGRASMPCRPWYQAKFMNLGAYMAPGAVTLAKGAAERNGHVLYFYSGSPTTNPGTAGVRYDFDLKPGESRSVDLRMPFVPIRRELAEPLRDMSYDVTFRRVVSFWESLFAKAMSVDVSDPKVTDTMHASLAYDLIARDIEADGTHFTQTVNKFQYHYFYPRDTSFIAHSYDLLNLPSIARETVEKYLVRGPGGQVVGFLRRQPDDWGQSLWAIGAHFRATGDLDFAKEVHPAIAPHLDEFVQFTSKDPLGLWPVAGPYDNELINGHYTSHNLWALLGLREAENLCRAVGDEAGAARAKSLYDGFLKVFLARLAILADEADGYIPPGMDDPLAGNDWENASGGVYPFGVLPPDNPWVASTVNMEREYKYREGIMTWGPNAWKAKRAAIDGTPYDPNYLHDYDTFQVTETLLARGEQLKVVEDLYSTLVHTSSTHAGFETSIRPWGDRDPDGNMPPHGWFAARYNELVRNMLLRERGDELHLASALAPDWVAPGKTVTVQRGASTFGSIDYKLHCAADHGVLEISPTWRTPPSKIVFHVPWFLDVSAAKADGTPTAVSNGVIELAPTTKTLSMVWTWRAHPDLSYSKAVALWLHKAYEPGPFEDRDHLFQTPTRPALKTPQRLFVGSYDLELVSRSSVGQIHYTLDGSTPNAASPAYSGPVKITADTKVEAVEVWPDGRVSEPLVATLESARFIDPVSATGLAPGLRYSYFEGQFESMPTFGPMTPTRTGIAQTADLDAVQHRAERFAVQLLGYVQVPEDGIYTFWTGSDDGSKLWIGDRLVVDNDGPHAYQEASGEVPLKAGLHPIRIEFFDAGGANSLHVFWSGPGFPKKPVEASALLTASAQGASPAPVQPFGTMDDH